MDTHLFPARISAGFHGLCILLALLAALLSLPLLLFLGHTDYLQAHTKRWFFCVECAYCGSLRRASFVARKSRTLVYQGVHALRLPPIPELPSKLGCQ